MMRRLVFIHELPCMRLVLPAFVCSVGSRVVAMDASLFGMRWSFMVSHAAAILEGNCRRTYPTGCV